MGQKDVYYIKKFAPDLVDKFIFRYKIKKLIRNRNKKCTRKLDFFNEFFTP